jgi:ribose transport system substrate-binding protein
MNRYFVRIIVVLVMVLLPFSCSREPGTKSAKKNGSYTIAVIPKGTVHEFWKSIHAGAIQASRETGTKIIWKGPLLEDDREEQIQLVLTFIGSGVDAIVLAPLDNRALLMPVHEAAARGIPTVIIDSDLEGKSYISFVATDNYRGGVLAAHRVAELLGGSGKIILIRYQEGSASNTYREEGFRDTILKEYPSLQILSDNQYVGPSAESAYSGCENLLNRFPKVDAIFAPNEPLTFGCLRALEELGLAGKVYLVGFDASVKLIQGLRNRTIHGLVLQDPFRMGYLGVMTAVRHLNGQTVEPRIDTGAIIVTLDNIDDPSVRELYSRDLSTYLNY